MENQKETVVNIHPILDVENPFNDKLIPVMEEDDLEDVISINSRSQKIEFIKVVENFVNKTKLLFNEHFEIVDNNTWKDKYYLIKYLELNVFIIVNHGINFLKVEEFYIFEKKDFEALRLKLNINKK